MNASRAFLTVLSLCVHAAFLLATLCHLISSSFAGAWHLCFFFVQVPFSKGDEAQMKYLSNKCLRVIGFIDKAKARRTFAWCLL